MAETLDHHPDPGLRPRVYDDTYENVFRSCVRAMEEMHTLELAEADPRRGVIEAWVTLAPMATLPGLGPPKDPRARGRGWFRRLEPLLTQGWVRIRVDDAGKGKVAVHGSLSLELPLARPLAGILLKNYLRWLDIRRGEPVKPGVLV